MLKQFLAVSLVLALSFLHSADAIKCYQCKSLTDPNCAKDMIDDTSNVHVVDCELVPKPNVMDQLKPVTKCNKVVTSDKAGVIVSRDCHFETVGQKSDECTVSHSRQVESCYTCKGDLCNASSAVRLVTMGVAVLLAMIAVNVAL